MWHLRSDIGSGLEGSNWFANSVELWATMVNVRTHATRPMLDLYKKLVGNHCKELHLPEIGTGTSMSNSQIEVLPNLKMMFLTPTIKLLAHPPSDGAVWLQCGFLLLFSHSFMHTCPLGLYCLHWIAEFALQTGDGVINDDESSELPFSASSLLCAIWR